MSTYEKATQLFNSKPELLDVAIGQVLGYAEEELAGTFDEMLNDTYQVINICGYTYSASEAFKEIDPIAYRQELLAYIDSLDVVEVEDYYFDESQLLDFIEQHTTDEVI